MAPRHLITLLDLQPAEFDRILDTAIDMKQSPPEYRDRLSGRSLAMIFEKPSLRTRVSFEMAIVQLGGHPVHLPGADIGLGKRESAADMSRCLGRWCDAIMIRTFATTLVEEMARHSRVPVINGLTDEYHPCQALADYMTMRECKGELRGLRVAYVGDGNNVAHSLATGAGHCGADLRIITPPGFEPDEGIVGPARSAARARGGDVTVGNDIAAGVAGAAAVYTDVWASMGQESDAERRRAIFDPFRIDSRIMQAAAPGAVFMHCLPAHRGEEVAAEVADSEASVIFRQAENRMHAQKALLLFLMAGLD